MSIKQAIEALEELIEYAETAGFDWSLDNARAALAALRSMPAEPVGEREAMLAAWKECKEACSPSDWTVADAVAYRGFFVHGWQAARATPHTAPLSDAWQPIETAPKDGAKALYWVVPKTRDEAYRNTSGEPIVSATPPHIFYGLHGGWSSLEKATLWQPLPPPPIERAVLGRGGEQPTSPERER